MFILKFNRIFQDIGSRIQIRIDRDRGRDSNGGGMVVVGRLGYVGRLSEHTNTDSWTNDEMIEFI